MASSCAVAIAAFFQIVLRISFFIEQTSDRCSSAPTLASWIFLIAFLDILLDISIYPIRYMHLPYICQIVAETIITVFLTEFGLLMVWCTIEKICCKLSNSLLLFIGMTPRFYYDWESYILGFVTITTSLAILLFVGQATDHVHFMRKRSMRLCRKINSYVVETWSKLRSLLMVANKCGNAKHSIEAECFNMDSEVIYPVRRNNNRRNRSKSRAGRSRSRNRR
ncbi:uncharacterized protein LOC111679452 [Lucilia cuprina]|uniref:uncharacterized protein LOC111679452 n=1 Tax=Lucilia cuprina TaxID=7375 RepID=UPI001F069A86|nr:uncharacterized protein LOC111679452 [Lucilia cuprina]